MYKSAKGKTKGNSSTYLSRDLRISAGFKAGIDKGLISNFNWIVLRSSFSLPLSFDFLSVEGLADADVEVVEVVDDPLSDADSEEDEGVIVVSPASVSSAGCSSVGTGFSPLRNSLILPSPPTKQRCRRVL
jgi:hypothetical protein